MAAKPSLNRLELLVGSGCLQELSSTSVLLFGVGGVGSWCAESLVRSGIGSLTIVDSDLVCATNINRQVQATAATIGKPKVDQLASRLAEISPGTPVTALRKAFTRDTAGEFGLDRFDYVIDCIDSLSNKVELIGRALSSHATLFSSMGASGRLDPTQIRVDSLWNVTGCTLGHLVRKRLRRRGISGDCLCVYSEERLSPAADILSCGTGACVCPRRPDSPELSPDWCSMKKQINGSVVHVTGTFGFILAGLVVQDVVRKASGESPLLDSVVARTDPGRKKSGARLRASIDTRERDRSRSGVDASPSVQKVPSDP